MTCQAPVSMFCFCSRNNPDPLPECRLSHWAILWQGLCGQAQPKRDGVIPAGIENDPLSPSPLVGPLVGGEGRGGVMSDARRGLM
jgi:hypothetical protein